MKARNDIVGMIFGSWTVLSDDKDIKTGVESKHAVVAKCKCGTIRSILANNIIRGRSKSCGCAKRRSINDATPDEWDAVRQ